MTNRLSGQKLAPQMYYTPEGDLVTRFHIGGEECTRPKWEFVFGFVPWRFREIDLEKINARASECVKSMMDITEHVLKTKLLLRGEAPVERLFPAQTGCAARGFDAGSIYKVADGTQVGRIVTFSPYERYFNELEDFGDGYLSYTILNEAMVFPEDREKLRSKLSRLEL